MDVVCELGLGTIGTNPVAKTSSLGPARGVANLVT